MFLEKCKTYLLKNKKQTFIICAVLASLLVLVLNAAAAMLPSVSLEQEARCGCTEHIHSDACYKNDILVCEIPAHVHDRNCYLVLLNENDINDLLIEIDERQDHSLEEVITETIDRAADAHGEAPLKIQEEVLQGTANHTEPPQSPAPDESEAPPEAEPAQTPEPEQAFVLNKENIARLNAEISQDQSAPQIVLNENINTPENAADNVTIPEEVQEAPPVGNEIMPLDVGDNPSTSNNAANFYIYLDGSWQCIGTMDYQNTSSGWTTNRTINTAQMLSFINGVLDSDFTANSFRLYYATSQNGNYNSAATINANSNTTFGQGSAWGGSSSPLYVRLVSTSARNGNDTSFAFYTVTYEFPDGTTEETYVRANTQITLPEGYSWTDDRGNSYEGDSRVNISRKITFTAEAESGFTIRYNVNFPTISGVTAAAPAVQGGVTSENIEEGNGTFVKDVTEREVRGTINSSGTGNHRVIYFKGWRVGNTDTILKPRTVLDWETLKSYGSRLTLNGVWEYEAVQTASFFVRFDSVAVDTDGNITGGAENLYTDELFAAYVGGTENYTYNELQNRYGIADTSADNSFTADQKIRALYGEKPTGVWMASFPNDDDIFEMLKGYAGHLSVDGIPVNVNDLNENGYAIRWYVFKCQNDAWHIDGKLVRKRGLIDVQKTFAGNKAAFPTAKDGFYIEAKNGTRTERLTLNNYTNYDRATETYTWRIDDVVYNEKWSITEHNYQGGDGYSEYSEYIVVDALGEQSTTGRADTVNVTGQTYALDAGDDEVLSVEFMNIYHSEDSLIIKKEDAETKRPIGGASFKLHQNGETLKFLYDAAAGVYMPDQERGTVTELSGANGGFIEIFIKGISFDYGSITVEEVKVPDGYVSTGNVTLTRNEDNTVTADGAEYNNGVLIIQNSSKTTSVTAQKEWLCSEYDRRNVTVQLLANGRLVSTLFSNIPAVVELNEKNNYTYQWDNLPASADGAVINWSIREIRIGNEQCRPDYTFANWIVYYYPPVYTRNEHGDIINTFLKVSNDVYRVMLRITKTDMAKEHRLAGVRFKLERLTEQLELDPGFSEKILETNANGELIFDDLPYGSYILTELSAADGYVRLTDPIYLTINDDNTISLSENYFAELDGSNSFSIIVKNPSALPLPETGGYGTLGLYTIGGLSMLMACVFAYLQWRKRGRIND